MNRRYAWANGAAQKGEKMNRNAIWPVILIVLGVVLLAHNLGLIHFAQLRAIVAVWWPLALIVIGVAALVPKKDRKRD